MNIVSTVPREQDFLNAQLDQAGVARARAAKDWRKQLKQRRRAARRAQWLNSRRVAKKRLGQLLLRLYTHRFTWSELLIAILFSCLLLTALLKLFFVPSDDRVLTSAVPVSSDVSATPKTEPKSAATAVTEQSMTEQCRLDAPVQLYSSDAEDGVALRFEPALTPVSPTQPMESTP